MPQEGSECERCDSCASLMRSAASLSASKTSHSCLESSAAKHGRWRMGACSRWLSMERMIEGQVENLGMLRTNGAKPPASSNDIANLREFCIMSIIRRSTADAEASSRQPSRMHANHTGVSIPANADRKICASWCFG